MFTARIVFCVEGLFDVSMVMLLLLVRAGGGWKRTVPVLVRAGGGRKRTVPVLVARVVVQ